MFFKFLEPIVNPPFFGLDISDLSIKFLRVENIGGDSDKKIDYYGEITVPRGIIANGEVKDENGLAGILKKELKDSRGRRVAEKFVAASLPEEKSFVRIIQLPKLKSDEISSAVRWELEANIPLPIDQVYFDYEVIAPAEPPTDHIDILITAFPRQIVNSYTAAIRDAGFYPLAIEMESQAISRAVVSKNLYKDAVIIVDLGMTRISFIVFGAGSIILTLSINIGGRDFNKAIADKLSVSWEEAEKIKKEQGLSKTYKGGVLLETLVPFLSTVVEEIRKQIWFYRDHIEHHHGGPDDISKILLVGGDANLIGMEKFLSVSLKKPVIAADPFINVYGENRNTVPSIPKNISLKYTTSIGLALRRF